MTDKVQKILSKIQTRKLCTMDEHMAFYNDKAKEDYEFLCEIEEFMKAFQEEPVSKDLEEASSEWDSKASFSPFYMVMDGDNPIDVKQDITTHAESFKAGAEWQKQKDEHLIWQISSANYEKGKQEAIEEMMKEAVESKVTITSKGILLEDLRIEDFDYEDKVKLIIIKED